MKRPPSKTQALLYLLGVGVMSTFFELYIIKEARTTYSIAFVPLMWIPGFIALACCNFFRSGFRELAMIKPGRTSILLAYSIPAGCAVATTLIVVLSDVGKYKWPEQSFMRLLVLQPTFGVAVNFVLALGGELGWRGYLHTHFMRARVPEPMIVTGLIWSVWHFPLILHSDYSTSSVPWLSAVLFTVTMTSFSVILGWLREFSKSVFPCALAYAVHLTWLQNICPHFYAQGKLDPFFAGQSGFILAIIYLMIAMYLYLKRIAASNY